MDKQKFLNPLQEPGVPFVTQKLSGRPGPAVAVSDYMHALPDMIRPWVPMDFLTLGTDGFGMSDTRGALRRHFLVDAESIVCRTLQALADRGELPKEDVQKALDRYRLWDPRAAEAGNTEGRG